MKTLLLVGLGGAAGSILRYVIGHFASVHLSNFQWHIGTFAANAVGCLLIGLVNGLAARYEWLTPQLRYLLVAGFCGGFTTFSTFSYENIRLLQNGQYALAAAYIAGTLATCLAATWVGVRLAG